MIGVVGGAWGAAGGGGFDAGGDAVARGRRRGFWGWWFWVLLVRPMWTWGHRRGLFWAGVAATVLLAAGTIAFGMTYHRLPTKSLMFRWHYWVGAGPMVAGHPWLGVGLNNFGDQYVTYKLPYSPEEVKDPHSFFVRLASEGGGAGDGAGFGVGGVVGVAGGFCGGGGRTLKGEVKEGNAGALLFGGTFCGAWWVSHYFLADAQMLYYGLLDFIYAAVGFGALCGGVDDVAVVAGKGGAGVDVGGVCSGAGDAAV